MSSTRWLSLLSLLFYLVTGCQSTSTSYSGQQPAKPMTDAPVVASILPSAGLTQSPVTIHGQRLRNVSQVLFAHSRAKFVVKSDTEIVAYVPKRAKTGYITVIVPIERKMGNKTLNDYAPASSPSPFTILPGSSSIPMK